MGNYFRKQTLALVVYDIAIWYKMSFIVNNRKNKVQQHCVDILCDTLFSSQLYEEEKIDKQVSLGQIMPIR